MNFHDTKIEFLPLTLPVAQAASAHPHPAGLTLADAAMLAFNFQLHEVHQQAPAVDASQVEGLAHWLQALAPEAAQATIGQRMNRADALRRMLDDPDWSLPMELAKRGRRLLDYLGRMDDLIPDEVPVIGQLDDALLVELCWSQFAGELQDYEDFCRFCREGRPRGSADERRTAWESACLAEAGAMLHRQQVRQRGYSRPAMRSQPFRVC